MKPQLIAALCVATAAATAADYTATSCRIRAVEGQWVDMSGFIHHLNVSHSKNSEPNGKMEFALAKYTNDGDGTGWKMKDFWDALVLPNDFQIGWQANDIYDGHQVGYVLRVWFNNGGGGYVPLASGNCMFSMSIQPNGDQYYWHETPVSPPSPGAIWADYRISIYGQWMASATLVRQGFDPSYANIPGLLGHPPAGYFN